MKTDCKPIWEEIDKISHNIVEARTVLHAMIPAIKKEKEKIASLTRKINVLIETVEEIEQGEK